MGLILTTLRGKMSRDEKIAVVEAYLGGLRNKDLSKVPFAEDVTCEGPLMPKLTGRDTVVGFLTGMVLPAVKAIRVKQHIVEGEYIATVFDLETTQGVMQVVDLLHVPEGKLKKIHTFYYPQTTTNA
jgi:hypothetical protein